MQPDLFTQAVQLQHAGDLPQAERLYREVLSHDPAHANALSNLALCSPARGSSTKRWNAIVRL